MNSIYIDLAPNVWLHSLVGGASHRYRGGLGFESRWSLDFFRLLLSSCLNWKINCDDHSSLSSTNRSSNMNYFIYTSHHFTSYGRYELNKLTSLPMCGFIAQLVEQKHRWSWFFELWSVRRFFTTLAETWSLNSMTDNSDGGCSRVGWWNVLLVCYLGIYKFLDSQIEQVLWVLKL